MSEIPDYSKSVKLGVPRSDFIMGVLMDEVAMRYTTTGPLDLLRAEEVASKMEDCAEHAERVRAGIRDGRGVSWLATLLDSRGEVAGWTTVFPTHYKDNRISTVADVAVMVSSALPLWERMKLSAIGLDMAIRWADVNQLWAMFADVDRRNTAAIRVLKRARMRKVCERARKNGETSSIWMWPG